MKILLGAASALALITVAGSAQAQDKGWTGPYVGAHAGWGWHAKDKDESVLFDTNLDGTFDNTVNTAAGANAFSPGFCDGAARSATPAAGCRKDQQGFEFGGRAGYDRQFGPFVLGGLVEFSRTDVRDSVTAFSTTPASYTMSRTLKGVGALRARAGYAMNDTLVYATGGVAKGRVKQRFETTNTANTFTLDDDKWASGYQLGGGVEHKFTPDVSLGLEYLYTNLNDDDFTVRAAGPAPATNPFILANGNGTDFRRSQDDLKTHSVRMTAAYRF